MCVLLHLSEMVSEARLCRVSGFYSAITPPLLAVR